MKNLIIRTISGICFLAVVVGCLLWCKFSFAALMLWITGMMMFEFYRMTMGSSYKFAQALAILAAVTLFVLTFFVRAYDLSGKFLMISFVPVFIVMLDSIYVKDKMEFGKFANIYTGLLYIAVPMTLTNFAVFDKCGAYSGVLILALFIIIWATDVGAYCFGITLGQKYGKKLFPEISPKKSWIGFWGGLATAMGAAMLLQAIGMLEVKLWQAALLGLIVAISGVYGDLIESQWKRHYAIKDSGASIPGHGGYLDRFDSALTAIPMGIVFMELFVL